MLGPYAQYTYTMLTTESNLLPNEAQTYGEALKSHESAHWQASMKHEVQQLKDQGA